MVFRKLVSDEERFWSRVNRDGPVPKNRPDLGPCWLWLGSHIRGYGQFPVGSRTDGSRRMLKAHRFAYALEEPIPEGLTLDHLCRTPLCVRKSHLEPVPAVVNTLRGDTLTTRNRDKTRCIHGHPFDAMTPDGRHRICRTCAALAQARYRMTHPAPPVTDAHRARNREYQRAHRARKRLQATEAQVGLAVRTASAAGRTTFAP